MVTKASSVHVCFKKKVTKVTSIHTQQSDESQCGLQHADYGTDLVPTQASGKIPIDFNGAGLSPVCHKYILVKYTQTHSESQKRTFFPFKDTAEMGQKSNYTCMSYKNVFANTLVIEISVIYTFLI